MSELVATYKGKAVRIGLPDDLTLEQERGAFYLAGEALLRERVTRELRNSLAEQGIHYDHIVEEVTYTMGEGRV